MNNSKQHKSKHGWMWQHLVEYYKKKKKNRKVLYTSTINHSNDSNPKHVANIEHLTNQCDEQWISSKDSKLQVEMKCNAKRWMLRGICQGLERLTYPLCKPIERSEKKQLMSY